MESGRDMVKVKNSVQYKVLIIDEIQDQAKHIKDILQKKNMTAVSISHINHAMKMVDNSFDAIIINLIKKNDGNSDFLNTFRKTHTKDRIPVIVLSNQHLQEDQISNIYNSGATDYIYSSDIPEDLYFRIKHHIQIKNKLKELIKENKKLGSELKKAEELYKMSMDFTNTLENQMFDHITNKELETKEQSDHIHKLINENHDFKDQIKDLNLLCDTLIDHDTIVEDSLTKEIETISIQADHDALTKIYNRKKFDEIIELYFNKFKKKKIIFTLLMYDIDHFKKINDTYGHDVGDIILIEITNLIKQSFHDHEIFARWGGEEFMIIYPDIQLKQGVQNGENLRQKIYQNNFNGSGKVSCSFGITQVHENDTLKSLLKRVDNALYRAKNNGRNCVKYL
jgi:diguanylate cyclase (GGDEF)-like protein